MNLKITIIQSELHWENVEENLAMFTKKIEAINEQTDIVVLPEMFTTGFSMESVKLAEKMDFTLCFLRSIPAMHVISTGPTTDSSCARVGR